MSVRAYATHGQTRHQTSCPVVEVPSNASLRELISFSLTVLQEQCELTFNIELTLNINKPDFVWMARGYHRYATTVWTT